MYWSCDMNTEEIVPLNEIIPNFTHKGRLYYLKNASIEFAGTLDKKIKLLQQSIVNKTKTAAEDDF